MPRKSCDEVQVEAFRRMTAEQRLELALRLRQVNLDLLEAGIRSRGGPLEPAAMRRRVLSHVLPAGLLARAFGPEA